MSGTAGYVAARRHASPDPVPYGAARRRMDPVWKSLEVYSFIRRRAVPHVAALVLRLGKRMLTYMFIYFALNKIIRRIHTPPEKRTNAYLRPNFDRLSVVLLLHVLPSLSRRCATHIIFWTDGRTSVVSVARQCQSRSVCSTSRHCGMAAQRRHREFRFTIKTSAKPWLTDGKMTHSCIYIEDGISV